MQYNMKNGMGKLYPARGKNWSMYATGLRKEPNAPPVLWNILTNGPSLVKPGESARFNNDLGEFDDYVIPYIASDSNDFTKVSEKGETYAQAIDNTLAEFATALNIVMAGTKQSEKVGKPTVLKTWPKLVTNEFSIFASEESVYFNTIGTHIEEALDTLQYYFSTHVLEAFRLHDVNLMPVGLSVMANEGRDGGYPAKLFKKANSTFKFFQDYYAIMEGVTDSHKPYDKQLYRMWLDLLTKASIPLFDKAIQPHTKWEIGQPIKPNTYTYEDLMALNAIILDEYGAATEIDHVIHLKTSDVIEDVVTKIGGDYSMGYYWDLNMPWADYLIYSFILGLVSKRTAVLTEHYNIELKKGDNRVALSKWAEAVKPRIPSTGTGGKYLPMASNIFKGKFMLPTMIYVDPMEPPDYKNPNIYAKLQPLSNFIPRTTILDRGEFNESVIEPTSREEILLKITFSTDATRREIAYEDWTEFIWRFKLEREFKPENMLPGMQYLISFLSGTATNLRDGYFARIGNNDLSLWNINMRWDPDIATKQLVQQAGASDSMAAPDMIVPDQGEYDNSSGAIVPSSAPAATNEQAATKAEGGDVS